MKAIEVKVLLGDDPVGKSIQVMPVANVGTNKIHAEVVNTDLAIFSRVNDGDIVQLQLGEKDTHIYFAMKVSKTVSENGSIKISLTQAH